MLYEIHQLVHLIWINFVHIVCTMHIDAVLCPLGWLCIICKRANRAKVFKQQSAKSVKSASTENAIKAHFYRRDCNYLYLGAQVIHLQVIPPWIEAGLGEITYVQVCRKMANNCWSKTIHHDENQAWSLIISAIPLLAKKCQSWLYLSPWLWFLGTNLHWFSCTAELSSPFEWALCNPSIRFV